VGAGNVQHLVTQKGRHQRKRQSELKRRCYNSQGRRRKHPDGDIPRLHCTKGAWDAGEAQMTFYMKKTFIDPESGIEMVNIHYTWTPLSTGQSLPAPQ
jgi:hypothetical protein